MIAGTWKSGSAKGSTGRPAPLLVIRLSLTRKIRCSKPEGEPVRNIVMVGEKADLQKLNDLLWSFSSTYFLPHYFIEDEAATDTTIVLTDDFASPTLKKLPHADVMIHLDVHMPADEPALVIRFTRIFY